MKALINLLGILYVFVANSSAAHLSSKNLLALGMLEEFLQEYKSNNNLQSTLRGFTEKQKPCVVLLRFRDPQNLGTAADSFQIALGRWKDKNLKYVKQFDLFSHEEPVGELKDSSVIKNIRLVAGQTLHIEQIASYKSMFQVEQIQNLKITKQGQLLEFSLQNTPDPVHEDANDGRIWFSCLVDPLDY